MAAMLHPPGDVSLEADRLPKHVAIIMDGNRRWARERRMPAIEGHRRGIVALREVTRAASDWGIPMMTVYGFSTENWKRDSTEISLLLDLCVYFAQSEVNELRRTMLESGARYLPVVQDGKLVGVISFRDVAKAVLEEQDFENKMLKGYIKNWPA